VMVAGGSIQTGFNRAFRIRYAWGGAWVLNRLGDLAALFLNAACLRIAAESRPWEPEADFPKNGLSTLKHPPGV